MKFRIFLKKYYFTIQFITIFLTSLWFMSSFYFDDRTFSFKDIPIYLNDFLFYWSVILSIGTPLIICYLLGAFDSENIKRIKSMDEIKGNLKHKPFFQFNSKGAYLLFMLLSIPTQIYLAFYLLYYKLLPFLFGHENISNNDTVFYLSLLFGIVVSLGIHNYIGLFNVDEIIAKFKNEKN